MLDQYSRAGYPVPEFTNPADHILDVISALTPKGQSEVQVHVENIQEEALPQDVNLLGNSTWIQLETQLEKIIKLERRKVTNVQLGGISSRSSVPELPNTS